MEAGELLECFQWSDEQDASAVQDELVDVRTYAYLLADDWGSIPLSERLLH
jgi:dCTP diphosphatase